MELEKAFPTFPELEEMGDIAKRIEGNSSCEKLGNPHCAIRGKHP